MSMWFLKPHSCTCTSPSKSIKTFTLDLGCFLASLFLEVLHCTIHIYLEIWTCKLRVCIQQWFLWMHNSSGVKSMKRLLQSMEAVSLFLSTALAITPLLPLASSFFVQLGLIVIQKQGISTFRKCITFFRNFFHTYCNMKFSNSCCCKTKAYIANFNCI